MGGRLDKTTAERSLFLFRSTGPARILVNFSVPRGWGLRAIRRQGHVSRWRGDTDRRRKKAFFTGDLAAAIFIRALYAPSLTFPLPFSLFHFPFLSLFPVNHLLAVAGKHINTQGIMGLNYAVHLKE